MRDDAGGGGFTPLRSIWGVHGSVNQRKTPLYLDGGPSVAPPHPSVTIGCSHAGWDPESQTYFCRDCGAGRGVWRSIVDYELHERETGGRPYGGPAVHRLNEITHGER